MIPIKLPSAIPGLQSARIPGKCSAKDNTSRKKSPPGPWCRREPPVANLTTGESTEYKSGIDDQRSLGIKIRDLEPHSITVLDDKFGFYRRTPLFIELESSRSQLLHLSH